MQLRDALAAFAIIWRRVPTLIRNRIGNINAYPELGIPCEIFISRTRNL